MLNAEEDEGGIRKSSAKRQVADDIVLPTASAVAAKTLDSPQMQSLHHRLLDLYTSELDRQYDNRIEMATDEDFYDNIQWREDDAQVLRERGQLPLVYNVISGTINWVIGTEKRGRSDFKVLPRRAPEGRPAERKTQLLKYLSDVNNTPFHRSRAFEDAVKCGVGWLEDGYGGDADGEPIYSRYESWRNIIWDSLSTEMDLSDARYLFRPKWVDQDIACALFPKRRGLIKSSANVNDYGAAFDLYGDEAMDQMEMDVMQNGSSARGDRAVGGYERRRVRLIEGWFRMPAEVSRLAGGVFAGELFDDKSPAHLEAVDAGDSEVVKRIGMKLFVSIMTPKGLVYCGPSPYRHNRFPFTPVWGNRRGRDGLPYGMIRGLRDIQEDVNKRASKALHILSTSKTIMEDGAVDDVDEYIEESARPDAVIVVNNGKKLEIIADRALAEGHLELMSRSIGLIQSASGVTDENLGRQTNAKSGIAIQRRQDQGATATTKYFDNYRFAFQSQGEKQLSLVEQFMTERKAFRITNMRGTPEYIEVNDGLPDNDVTRSKADFVISDADWRASLRQAAADELLEVMTRMPPQVAMAILDLVVENMDLPNRDEIVKRIRSLTGQRDPDADPDAEMTPEEKAQAQAKAAQAKLQEELAMANLRKIVAEALRAEKQAEAAHAQSVQTGVKALGGPKRGAIDIAADVATAPATAHVADGILHEFGFVGQTEIDTKAMLAAQQEQQAAAEVAQLQSAQKQAAAQTSPNRPPVIGLGQTPTASNS